MLSLHLSGHLRFQEPTHSHHEVRWQSQLHYGSEKLLPRCVTLRYPWRVITLKASSVIKTLVRINLQRSKISIKGGSRAWGENKGVLAGGVGRGRQAACAGSQGVVRMARSTPWRHWTGGKAVTYIKGVSTLCPTWYQPKSLGHTHVNSAVHAAHSCP